VTTYSIQDGALVLPAGEPVRFPQAVRQVVEFDGVLVVRLEWSTDNNRNVYAVDATGRTLWRIEDPLGAIYLGIGKVDERTVRAVSAAGVSFDIDPWTGRVITSILTK
jgi:hypothetical protein